MVSTRPLLYYVRNVLYSTKCTVHVLLFIYRYSLRVIKNKYFFSHLKKEERVLSVWQVDRSEVGEPDQTVALAERQRVPDQPEGKAT